MSLQQIGQPKSSNGYGRWKSEKERATKSDNKFSGKSNACSRLASTGVMTGNKGGSYESTSRDRLVYLTTCLIGQQVEVQVKNGSIYSGIFHATNTDKDFGIILKMACLTKDGSFQGQRSGVEFVSKAPSKTLIIPANDLVQVIAKNVAVSRDGLSSESHHDMHEEIMVDSVISQSRHVELGRELQRWVPDEDDPQCPEMESTFDGPWKRDWDQFETNEMLFGVKSTFNEELYTTKLEKGPQMRELEKEALRIAREIEGEETQDLHLAEERGIYHNFNIDEETRFSSVYRGKGVDDSGYDENEDKLSDSQNSETFGDMYGSSIKKPGEISGRRGNTGAQTWSNFTSVDHSQSSQSSTGVALCRSGSNDHAKQLAPEPPAQSCLVSDGERRIQENSVSDLDGAHDNAVEENWTQAEDAQLSKSEDLQSSLNIKKDGSSEKGLSPDAASGTPSTNILSKTHEGTVGELTGGSASVKANKETKSVNSRGRLGSTQSGLDCVVASSGPGLSPSSSVGSMSSEKSTLNPNAKEFKLNPNAKSFIPSQTHARPRSPVSDGSYYYPPNVTTVPNMPAMPMGIGVGTTFAGPQPVIYNPQVAQIPSQPYFHPNGPQYGQLPGHPRQVLYMPSYLPETPYRGRDY
ncbi:polyadenylate-binding protein-interacting protein 3-like [Abrus precatorius]|uniref:Polyadenylate-binding protein-interacting protein 3-like n=1 Tax=Abrus precatorius TaxID=3816 RepID=A0A8B8JUF8_ABRPR|nr:polyadenylate-binding protein-interacting protein 3-like [Abrus precatorius]XP_027335061.1 polyadenylate-binding protein-interacting protein 3-like [Abrus precatorius]